MIGFQFSFNQVAGQLIGPEAIGICNRNIDKEEGGQGEVHHSLTLALACTGQPEDDIPVSKRKT